MKVNKKNMDLIDVSVPRKENKTGAGHRKFEIETNKNMSIEEAVSRRDFTFNALLYDNSKKELIDAVGGKEDFKNGIIRHVSEKFGEDPLRVLRAFQFASRFDMKIASETAAFSKSLKDEYKLLSNERVQEEYTKFWTRGTNYQSGLKLLQETEWDDTEPGLKNAIIEILPNINKIHDLKEINNDNKIIIGTALITSKMNNKDRENFIRKTVIGNSNQSSIRKILIAQDTKLDTTLDRKLFAEKTGFTFETLYNFAIVSENEKLKNISLEAKKDGVWNTPIHPFIQGRDILLLTDRKPGKWMGGLLTKFKMKQYNNEFKDKDDALTQLKNILIFIVRNI